MKAQSTVISVVATTRNQAWQTLTCDIPGANAKPNLRLTGDKFQTVDGFGGSFSEIGWQTLRTLGAKERRTVFKELFDVRDGGRFAVCRLPVGASDYATEWYSYNETDNDLKMEHFSIARDKQGLVPYVKEAQTYRPSLAVLATPWSPPVWMKHPRVYNSGSLQWKKEILQAYALYLTKYLEAYAEQGINISQLHLQNEPLTAARPPSCVWSGEQVRDFIRDFLGPLFKKYGVETEIWLGSLETDDYNGYPNLVLSDAAAVKCVSGVSVNHAGKELTQRVHASWPSAKVYLTQNASGDGSNSWDQAQQLFDLILHQISNGANACVYDNMVLPPGGHGTWGGRQNALVTVDPDSKVVVLNPDFYIMKHFSGFVEAGAVRLGVQGPLASNAAAFQNPNGSVVAVINNPMKENRLLTFSDAAGNMMRTDLPAQSYTTILQAPA